MTLYAVEDGSVCRADLSKASLGLKGISGDQPAKSSSGKDGIGCCFTTLSTRPEPYMTRPEPLAPGRKVSQVSFR